MRYEQNLSQKQTVSTRTVLAAKILQMETDELWDYIEQQSLENPVIDLDSIPSHFGHEPSLRDKLDWFVAKGRPVYPDRAPRDDSLDESAGNDYWDMGRSSEPDLAATLLSQLTSDNLRGRELSAARYIAENLDESGFFTEEPEEAAEKLGIPLVSFFDVLRRMQSLDPPGICAYDLQHCLSLQVERLGGDPLCNRIIMDHLELLAKNEPHIIARAMREPFARVSKCCDFIRTLDPRPGGRFSDSENTRYILPDINILPREEGFAASFTDRASPRIVISDYYRSLFKCSGDGDADSYINEKLRQAQWLQHCIVQRQSTLLSIANSIAQLQRDFFACGPERLVPLNMADVSRLVGVHESTVSRAVKGKYVQCSWGLYPMSYFFPKGIKDEHSAGVTSDSIKARLQEIIDAEDKNHPMNDRILADILNDSGLPISRRTVTKYRMAMGIPAISGRKARSLPKKRQ